MKTAKAVYLGAKLQMQTAKAVYLGAKLQMETAKAVYLGAKLQMQTAKAVYLEAKLQMQTAKAVYLGAKLQMQTGDDPFCPKYIVSIGAYPPINSTLKPPMSDKTFSVVRASAYCLLTHSDQTLNLISSLSDIEASLELCLKSLEGVYFNTRRSLPKLIASFLASTQVYGSAVMSSNPSAEEKYKTLLTPDEMMD
ncbi:hypothetical protein KEM48_003050 [Puccinia striiformis f. sp. tritici PST-130]|nr:hypothetical protein KEM48_003050 [Puccinia striiformis f. sp. tritici PST-130]